MKKNARGLTQHPLLRGRDGGGLFLDIWVSSLGANY